MEHDYTDLPETIAAIAVGVGERFPQDAYNGRHYGDHFKGRVGFFGVIASVAHDAIQSRERLKPAKDTEHPDVWLYQVAEPLGRSLGFMLAGAEDREQLRRVFVEWLPREIAGMNLAFWGIGS